MRRYRRNLAPQRHSFTPVRDPAELALEFEAFDSLPPDLRKAIANHHLDTKCRAVADGIADGEFSAAEMIALMQRMASAATMERMP